MKMNTRSAAAIFVSLGLAATGSVELAAQGQCSQEEMTEIINKQMELSFKILMGDNTASKELIQLINNMSPECRKLFEMYGQMQPPGGGDVMCRGGVCCDATGCY